MVKTQAQIDRQQQREPRSGRYTSGYKCDYCGKNIPAARFFSDDRCNTYDGWGQFLHSRCARSVAKVADKDYLALFQERQRSFFEEPATGKKI